MGQYFPGLHCEKCHHVKPEHRKRAHIITELRCGCDCHLLGIRALGNSDKGPGDKTKR